MQGDYRLPNYNFTRRRRTSYRRMGTAQTKLPEASPQSLVLQPAHFRETSFPSRRYRRTGTNSLFSAGKRIRRKGRCDRTTQSRRPNGLGA